MIAESFIFYDSFAEALQAVPKKYRLECYEAITEYALSGSITPTSNHYVKIVLAQARPQIDANRKRRENGAKGGKYGSLGGRGKKKNPIGVNEENPIGVKTDTPNVNVNVNDNDNDLKEDISKRDIKKSEPSFNFKASLLELGVPEEYASEWMTIRKRKGGINTAMALKVLVDEAAKAEIMVADAVRLCCENQWRGFKAEYYANLLRQQSRERDTGTGGRLRSTEEMEQIVAAGRKLYEQSLNYR